MGAWCARPRRPRTAYESSRSVGGAVRTAGSFAADIEVGHMFQALDQRRMVPVAAADGRTGAEHLLGVGGVGQVQAQLAGAGQGQVEILLVQADAEARIEGSL